MTTPIGPPPSAALEFELYPSYSVAVDVSSADVNLAALFTAGFARELYIGGSGNLVAQLLGDAAAQTYEAVPTGTVLRGLWILVAHTNTTATHIIARY